MLRRLARLQKPFTSGKYRHQSGTSSSCSVGEDYKGGRALTSKGMREGKEGKLYQRLLKAEKGPGKPGSEGRYLLCGGRKGFGLGEGGKLGLTVSFYEFC